MKSKVITSYSDGTSSEYSFEFTAPTAKDAIAMQERSVAAGKNASQQYEITLEYCQKYLTSIDGHHVDPSEVPPGILTLIALEIQDHATMGKGWKPGS